MMDTRAVEELTEYDIGPMTPPQFAEFVAEETCMLCDLVDVCDGSICLFDVMEKERDHRDEQRQAWRPL